LDLQPTPQTSDAIIVGMSNERTHTVPNDTQRDAQILLARVRGDTLADIGSQHRLTHQAVSQIVVRERQKHITKIEMQLLVARKQDEAFGLAIPYGADYQLGLRYFAWVLDALRARDLDIHAEARQTTEGTVLFLTDQTDYTGGAE
jgi:hypothetical protein